MGLHQSSGETDRCVGRLQEIRGIIHWKREQITETKFDKDRAKELFEAEYNAAFRAPTAPLPTKPNSNT